MKDGTAQPARTIKAGCGIRYAPEQLEDSPGFDFSAARALLENHEGMENKEGAEDKEAVESVEAHDANNEQPRPVAEADVANTQEKDPAGTAGQSTE